MLLLCIIVDIGDGDHFSYFLKLVASLQDGSIVAEAFEEQMRELFTTEAYIGFTIDKLIGLIAKRVHKFVARVARVARVSCVACFAS